MNRGTIFEFSEVKTWPRSNNRWKSASKTSPAWCSRGPTCAWQFRLNCAAAPMFIPRELLAVHENKGGVFTIIGGHMHLATPLSAVWRSLTAAESFLKIMFLRSQFTVRRSSHKLCRPQCHRDDSYTCDWGIFITSDDSEPKCRKRLWKSHEN